MAEVSLKDALVHLHRIETTLTIHDNDCKESASARCDECLACSRHYALLEVGYIREHLSPDQSSTEPER